MAKMDRKTLLPEGKWFHQAVVALGKHPPPMDPRIPWPKSLPPSEPEFDFEEFLRGVVRRGMESPQMEMGRP